MTDETQKEVIKQNGIKRPESGSITGKLWDIADDISASVKRPATRKEVVDRYMAEVPNANQATANTQYARWVTFHGASDALRDLRAQETAARREAKGSEKSQAQLDREAARKAKADAQAAAKEEKARIVAAKKAALEDERNAKRQEREAEKERKREAKAAEQAALAAVRAGAETNTAA